MINLIKSENLKLYMRQSTWVMFGVLMLTVVLSVVYTPKLKEINELTIWGMVADQTSLLFLIELFVIIAASGIVAHEFNWGTIKLLLIRPVKRSRILLAKYLSLLLYGLILMGLLFLLSLILNGITHGLVFKVKDSLPHETLASDLWFNSLSGVILLYGLRYIEVIIYGSMAFMLSTVSKSSTFALGVSLMTMLIGPELNQIVATKAWAKYLLFVNLNLSNYLDGSAPLPGMSLGFSIFILGSYLFIFNAIAWIVFVSRDVMN